jgi:hypothetical protein
MAEPAINSPGRQRRSVQFRSHQDVLDDIDTLLDGGYQRLGNWSLGMSCHHLASTIEMAYFPGHKGFPRFLRPVLRFFVLRRILRKGIPRGMPAPNPLQPDAQITDRAGRDRLADVIQKISSLPHAPVDHPVFGRLSPDINHRLQMTHAAHHLSLLIPTGR